MLRLRCFVCLTPFGGLGVTYDVHLRLKRVVNFLLVLINFFASCYRWGAIRANINWKSAISLQCGPADPKFKVEGSPPPIFHQKTRVNDLSCNIRMWAQHFLFCHKSRVCQTDRRIDRHNSHRYRPRLHSMQCGKNDCRWLSRSSIVHQIRFRPELCLGPRYILPTWFKGSYL